MNSATVCLGARRYWADGVKVETVRKCMSVSSWSGESVSAASWQLQLALSGRALGVCLSVRSGRDRSAFGSSLPFFRSTYKATRTRRRRST